MDELKTLDYCRLVGLGVYGTQLTFRLFSRAFMATPDT